MRSAVLLAISLLAADPEPKVEERAEDRLDVGTTDGSPRVYIDFGQLF